MSKTIRVEYELSQSPAKVWRLLTDSKLLAQWLMPNDIRAEVGHRFTFKAQPFADWDGTVECEVLEVQPLERFRYSWRGGSVQARLVSEVLWTLTPNGNGTKLVLEHSGFEPHNEFAYQGMAKGWAGKVQERMEGLLRSIDAVAPAGEERADVEQRG